jgi:hypothetical protein
VHPDPKLAPKPYDDAADHNHGRAYWHIDSGHCATDQKDHARCCDHAKDHGGAPRCLCTVLCENQTGHDTGRPQNAAKSKHQHDGAKTNREATAKGGKRSESCFHGYVHPVLMPAAAIKRRAVLPELVIMNASSGR